MKARGPLPTHTGRHSAAPRRKLDLLINLKLRDATRSGASLAQIMSEISQKAQERRLTPEILKSILDEQ